MCETKLSVSLMLIVTKIIHLKSLLFINFLLERIYYNLISSISRVDNWCIATRVPEVYLKYVGILEETKLVLVLLMAVYVFRIILFKFS
jgi:hypothetical protein